jgi:hypothetical protein
MGSPIHLFDIPRDLAELSDFVREHFGKPVRLNVAGIEFSLDQNQCEPGELWYTSPYGIDGIFSFLNESGEPCIEKLIEEIKEEAEFWSKPRDERGCLLA